MRAYLDTNVVSTIARNHIPQESAAVDRLLRASDAGKVELLTSRVTEEEIAGYLGAGRVILERAYRLIRKIAYVETSTLLGFNSYGDRDCFLTCDRGILHHKARIGTDFSIQVLRPSDLVAHEGW